MGDGHLVLSRHLVPEAISLLESEGPRLGLYISANIPKPKCELYWPSDYDGLKSYDGLSSSTGDGTLILGSPIGSDHFIESILEAKLEELEENHNALMHLDHAQSQLTLLRNCLSACKVMFLLRTVPLSCLLLSLGRRMYSSVLLWPLLWRSMLSLHWPIAKLSCR